MATTTLDIVPASDVDDALFVPLFPDSPRVGQVLQDVELPEGRGRVGILYAKSGRIVGFVLYDASRLLPTEMT